MLAYEISEIHPAEQVAAKKHLLNGGVFDDALDSTEFSGR